MTIPLITSVSVDRLFGLYSYRLPDDGNLTDASILYGDNGVGKSTILKIVFYLLSSATNKGHQATLYNTPFDRLIVETDANVIFSATRVMIQKRNILRLGIRKDGKPIVFWNYHPPRPSRPELWQLYQSELDVIDDLQQSSDKLTTNASFGYEIPPDEHSIPEGEDLYLGELSKNAPNMFLLNAERRLDSDAVSDFSEELEFRRLTRTEDPRRIKDLVSRAREITLSQALGTVSEWIGRKAFKGANDGVMNVHSVYQEALRFLLAPQGENSSEVIPIQKQIQRLAEIEKQTADFATYDLHTALSTVEFRDALKGNKEGKAQTATDFLEPYIKSLEARISALRPLYETVDKFVKIINRLLTDKSIIFQTSQGFRVENRLGYQLKPSQLSSGEQQLLLLFCYVLTAREQPSVFMIDEPEISLNVKWQRQLIQDLLEITEGEPIQFMFASHSLELLNQHRKRVVKLVNKL